MAGLRQVSQRSLADVKGSLRALPLTLAARVASKSAPALTASAGAAYDAGRTVYGASRPLSVDGAPLSLKRTGAVRGTVRFVAVGTILRCVLSTRYAKYLIGKYGILPCGARARLPGEWRKLLGGVVQEEGDAILKGAR